MAIRRLEYIWLDGNDTPQLRSKTRFAESVEAWNFDGGSTNQGTLQDSDRILKPVKTYTDPFSEDPEDLLVLCEVYHYGTKSLIGKRHSSNFRKKLTSFDTESAGPWVGFEQEFTFMHPQTKQPLGFLLEPQGQGPYYCGVGRDKNIGRDIMEEFEKRCKAANIEIDGINAEVMPGQWEYQTHPKYPTLAADDLWVTRYILERISEKLGVLVSFDPKPHPDYNGAGCHTNFSTRNMRESFSEEDCSEFMKCLEEDHKTHLEVCGEGYEQRMTGDCETPEWETFTWHPGDRGCSVRIPKKVWHEKQGYIEDRRPCANIDPYKLLLSLLGSAKKSKSIWNQDAKAAVSL